MSVPKETKAIIVVEKDALIKTIPLPELRPTYLLVKVDVAALNPTDWKHVTYGLGGKPFSIVGCDFSGTVVSIGSEVTKSFAIGQKVYGCAHGSNAREPYDGVFSEFAMVKGDTTMIVSESSEAKVTMEDLATIPLGSITVGQGLFQQNKGLGIGLPEEGKGNGEWLLIYGGSTATGSLAIQFAKLAGYRVITTCSPRNNDFVKSRGADEVFDYSDPKCGAKIRELTGDKLKLAWDTINEGDSPKICDEALSSDSVGCYYGGILSASSPRGLKTTHTIMYTMFGEEFILGDNVFPASNDDFKFGKQWMSLTERLVAEGKITPHPKKLGSGGLEGILDGMQLLKDGKVTGEKLVYKI